MTALAPPLNDVVLAVTLNLVVEAAVLLYNESILIRPYYVTGMTFKWPNNSWDDYILK